VVDEAFIDVAPAAASVAGAGRRNVVVLRSFGNSMGSPGCGSALRSPPPELAGRLHAALGPWAVSGPAIAVGEGALADEAWREATRARLAATASRLDETLRRAALEVVGGTSLFRLWRTPAANQLFDRLGGAGLYVRRFAEQPMCCASGCRRANRNGSGLQRRAAGPG